MESNLKFSVLVSVYAKDNVRFLKEALDSVINQTCPPDEIIMAIDGPIPDETKQILEEYAKKHGYLKNVFLTQNKGRGEAIKETLPLCKHDLVALADADDINLPVRFEKLLHCFKNDDNLSAAGGQVEEFDAISLKNIAGRKVPLSNEDIREYVKSRSPVNQPTVMFKKKDIIAAGSYRNFHLLEDYDLWIRLAANNFKMQNVDEVLVKMRITPNSYQRRGGWKYFKSNKALQDELLRFKMISNIRYLFNLFVRFTVQVLMPNFARSLFYRIFLR